MSSETHNPFGKFNLEEAMKDYWEVHDALYNRNTKGITVEQANRKINKHLRRMNPERPLYKKMESLLDDIVAGKPRTRSNLDECDQCKGDKPFDLMRDK